MSWQASQPSGPVDAVPPAWAAGQGKIQQKETATKTHEPEVKNKEKQSDTGANKPAATPAAAPVVEVSKEKKDVAKPKTSASLLLLTMIIEGISFGSLYGWAVQRNEGVSLPETRKVLGLASVIGPLLVIDRDCTTTRLSDLDFGLLAVHMMLSLKSLFERSSKAFGPWSFEKIPADNTLAIVAFWLHMRCFLHLLTKESQQSIVRKLALLTSFALGSNLTIM